MSALEFTQELQQAIATNPFLLEEEDLSVEQTSAETDGASPQTGESPSQDSVVNEGETNDRPTDQANSVSYASDYGGGRRSNDDEAQDASQWTQAATSLHDHLHHELCGYRLGERDHLLAQCLIEALDDDGYLRQDFHELAMALDIKPAPAEAEWLLALTLVQQLDVPGLAARDLSECLALQLEALVPDTPGRDLALRIVAQHLPLLAKRETAEMKRRLACTESQQTTACQLIRSLDPKPGLRFSAVETDHIVPDVIVQKVKGQWLVSTNPAVMPKARLHHAYADLFRRARCDDRAPLAQELQEARWLIRNVEQRFVTIQRVAEAIVAYQKTFFDYGDVAMRPLVLRKVAEELDLHESTVSRATNNKYMATPRGVFEFKHFFSRELATDTGGRCSAAAVRALIKDMIATEQAPEPLSDVALTRMLAQQGVVVARRTVTKYRDQMKLPPADLRKQP